MQIPLSRMVRNLQPVAMAALVLLSFPLSAQSQGENQPGQQQPPAGPAPQVGETVIAPKKTTPAPVPEEKKPERINPSEVYTLSKTANLVNVDVLVTDNGGNPITTLGRVNFKVLDDGVQQTVTNFGTSEAPLTVCMLVEFANRNWRFLYLALEYAYQFLNVMKPSDWLAVVDFDMKPHILTDFTQDRSQVKAALDTLRIPGFSESNLYDSLAFAIDRMKDIQGRKAIVPICSGIDTFSKLTYPQMLKIAKASDTAIYPVSILEFLDVRSAGSMTAVEAKNELTYIAQYSGGQAYFPRFEQDLPGIYEQVAGQLRTQYSLGFVPSNPAKDGKYHKLKVELVDEQGTPLRITNEKGKQVKYKVVARDGYYAPKV
jgi:VWFA-related protein